MGFKTFNDRLALIVILLILCLWIGNHWLQLPGEIIGVTIAAWTLVLQFYFRRKPADTTVSKPDNTITSAKPK
jgi:hypothetical protein